ncbi:hypothetical protein VNO77_19156 [Canavalia gladiata]|uniref:Uncharacterized protein n=1 Tax=Canavalia gladiata TaxID=3824 RepID=A0AAN9LS26_CANGL
MEGPFGFGLLGLLIPQPPLWISPFSSQLPHLGTVQEEESSPLRSIIELLEYCIALNLFDIYQNIVSGCSLSSFDLGKLISI